MNNRILALKYVINRLNDNRLEFLKTASRVSDTLLKFPHLEQEIKILELEGYDNNQKFLAWGAKQIDLGASVYDVADLINWWVKNLNRINKEFRNLNQLSYETANKIYQQNNIIKEKQDDKSNSKKIKNDEYNYEIERQNRAFLARFKAQNGQYLSSNELYDYLGDKNKNRIIISDRPIESFIETNDWDNLVGDKPNGLWFSYGGEWLGYIRYDDPKRLKNAKFVYELEIDNSKILSIPDDYTINEFHEKFGYKKNDPEYGNKIYVNWAAVKSQYSGIEVKKYDWNLRCDNIYPWYSALDRPSGCIWGKDGFKSVKIIAKKIADDQWEILK